MELAALAALGILGYKVQEGKTKRGSGQTPTATIKPHNTDNHIYSSNSVSNAKAITQKVANTRTELSKTPMNTGIIPNFYNIQSNESEDRRFQDELARQNENYTRSISQYDQNFNFTPTLPTPDFPSSLADIEFNNSNDLLPPPKISGGALPTINSTNKVEGFMSVSSGVSSFDPQVDNVADTNSFLPPNTQPFFSKSRKIPSMKRTLETFTGTMPRQRKREVMGAVPVQNAALPNSESRAQQYTRETITTSSMHNNVQAIDSVKVSPIPDGQVRIKAKNISKRQATALTMEHSNPKKGIDKRGVIPNVEKRTPDTSFIQNPGQWLVTKAAALTGQTIRSKVEQRAGQRATTSEISYTGNAKDATNNAQAIRSEFTTPSYKHEVETDYMGVAGMDTQGHYAEVESFDMSASMRGQGDSNPVTNYSAASKGINNNYDLLEPTMAEQLIKEAESMNIRAQDKSYTYDPNEFTPAPNQKHELATKQYESQLQTAHRSYVNDTNELDLTMNDLTRTELEGPAFKLHEQAPAYDKDELKPDTTTRETYEPQSIPDQGHLSTQINKSLVYDPDDLPKMTIGETLDQRDVHESTFIGNTTKSLVYDPDDLPKTTIGETLEQRDVHETTFLSSATKSLVYDPDDLPKITTGETTATETFGRSNANLINNPIVYDPNDIPDVTIKESMLHESVGAMQAKAKPSTYNMKPHEPTIKDTTLYEGYGTGNVSTNKTHTNYDNIYAPKTTKETTNYDEVMGPKLSERGAYEVAGVDAPVTNRQETTTKSFIKPGKGKTQSMVYDGALNAELKEDMEAKMQNYAPTASSVKITSGKEAIIIRDSDELPNVERKQYKSILIQPPVRFCYEE